MTTRYALARTAISDLDRCREASAKFGDFPVDGVKPASAAAGITRQVPCWPAQHPSRGQG